jgi:hypothetical protein
MNFHMYKSNEILDKPLSLQKEKDRAEGAAQR